MKNQIKKYSMINKVKDYVDFISAIEFFDDILDHKAYEDTIDYVASATEDLITFNILIKYLAEVEEYEYAGIIKKEILKSTRRFKNFISFKLDDALQINNVMTHQTATIQKIIDEIDVVKYLEEII